jgi:hypothetical protein
MKKQQKKYEQQFYGGETVYEDETIKYSKKSVEGEVNPEVGEYVDFEEIDDKQDSEVK